MSKDGLAPDEKSLLDAVESGAFQSVLIEARKDELADVTRNTVRKDKRINIRVSNRDLSAIQSRAMEEGIPYQPLPDARI